MANAVEAVGEAVDEEATDELVRIERHLPGRVAMAIIAPAEDYAAIRHLQLGSHCRGSGRRHHLQLQSI